MSAEVINVEAPKDWIAPLRNNIRNIGAIYGCDLERKKRDIPVVTYINRQKTGRRLNETDAENVLTKLQELHDEGKIEFYNAQMETLPRIEQFCLASRTDVSEIDIRDRPLDIDELPNRGRSSSEYMETA